jgi:lipopolysaccharide/colanic/teichoic acid biosynthesis glycosyltransferase
MTVATLPRVRRVVVLRPAGETSACDAAAYRVLDLALAVPPLVLLSPALVLIAAAIQIDTGGPPVIAQPRVGLDFEPFRLFVFRTRARGQITRVGAALERRGLHRLPSLLNVIRGDMSIVGPPPLSPAELERVSGPALERFAVKPGLVYPVAGADADSRWLEYVQRRSLRLNLQICAGHLAR